ncbi:unnamed protein product [Echinostoma caproni]|uniref:NR LBD domain-containing protein n=1 Tax=Echinostoma caproni TaxID=27848 RepID=A0A183A6V0_9TREM|nr:unnamed protein product [Echinostoma caproni]
MAERNGLIDRITDAAAVAAAAAAGFPSSSTDGGLADPVNRGSHVFFAAGELPHSLVRFDAHSIPTSLTYFTESQLFSPISSFREKSMLEEACEQQSQQQQSQQQQHQQSHQSEQSAAHHHDHSMTSMDYQLQPMTTGPLTGSHLTVGLVDNATSASYQYYSQSHHTVGSTYASAMLPPTQSMHETHETHESPHSSAINMYDLQPAEVDPSMSASKGMSCAMLSSSLIEVDTSPTPEKTEPSETLDPVSLGVSSLCLICGDRATAVQNERDKISNRPLAFDSITSGQSLLDLQQLLNAESRAQSLIQNKQNIGLLSRSSQDATTTSSDDIPTDPGESTQQFADVTDICDSIKTQLMFLIEWAKNLPSFGTLKMNDQVALLQSHAGEMLILGAVWRSLSKTNYSRIYSEEARTSNPITTATPGSRAVECSGLQSKPRRKSSSIHSSQHTQLQNTMGWSSLPETEIRPHSSSSHTSESSQNSPSLAQSQPPQAALSVSSSLTGQQQQSVITQMSSTPNPMVLEPETMKATGLMAPDPGFEHQPQLILLGNSRIISRHSPQQEIADIANQILDQLYQPMLELCLEDAEIACLRAIIFFDPNCSNLSDHGRHVARACQYQIQTELMHLMNDKLYLPQGRFGALLLLLPDLRSITYRMIDRLQIAKQMGLTRLDGLLSDILLSGYDLSERCTGKPNEPLQTTEPEGMTGDIHPGEDKLEYPATTLTLYSRGSAAINVPTTGLNEQSVCEYTNTNVGIIVPTSTQRSSSSARTTQSDQTGLTRLFDRDLAQSAIPSAMSGASHTPSQSTTRTGLMSGSTAFVPYVQRQPTAAQQNPVESYMSTAATARLGWADFGFGRSHMSGSMFDYAYQHAPDSELVHYPGRRFSSGESESRPSFLLHVPHESFEHSIGPSSSFDTSSAQVSGSIPLDITSYESAGYYTTGHASLHLSPSSSNDPVGRSGLAFIPSSCTAPEITSTNTASSASPSATRADLVPRLMGNMFSHMFSADSQNEDTLYPFYHSNP